MSELVPMSFNSQYLRCDYHMYMKEVKQSAGRAISVLLYVVL